MERLPLTQTLEMCIQSFGEYKKAREHLEKSLVISRRTLEIDQVEKLSSNAILGAVYASLFEYEKAKEHLR